MGFDELVSFIAGWAVVLDLLLLTAIGAEAFSGYLTSIVPELRDSSFVMAVVGLALIIGVGIRNSRGPNLAKGLGVRLLLAADALVLAVLALLLLIESIDRGLPLMEMTDGVSLQDVAYAATIGVVAVTGFETAATLSGETRLPAGRRARFLIGLVLGTVVTLVIAGALGAAHRAELSDPNHLDAPVAWLAGALEPTGWPTGMRIVVAVLAATTLAVATNGAMLAVARLSSTLATSRQIPARIGGSLRNTARRRW